MTYRRRERRKRKCYVVGVWNCSGHRAQTLSLLWDHGRGLSFERLRDYNAETGSGSEGRAVNKGTKALLNPRLSCNPLHAHYMQASFISRRTLVHFADKDTDVFPFVLQCCFPPPHFPPIQTSSASIVPPPGPPLGVWTTAQAHSLCCI